MRNNSILVAILLFIFISQIPNNECNRNNEESISTIYTSLKATISSLLNKAITNTGLNISQKCINSISSIYINYKENETDSIDQLISYSTKNKNDAMTFEVCMRKANTKYLIVQLKESTHLSSLHLDYNTYIFALCLSNDISCLDNDYKAIISYISNTTHGFIKSTAEDDIRVFQLRNKKKEMFRWIDLLSFIPSLFILIQLLFIVFRKIPYFLFIRCMCIPDSSPSSALVSENNNKTSSMKISSFYYSKQFIEIENAYSLVENSEEIINYKAMTSKINNESGLVYVKGLRGIALLLLVIGEVFVILWKSPANIYSLQLFEKTIRNFRYSLVFFGVRYSPAILFSCSGFVLIFKFMCFLDDKIEETSIDEGNIKDIETSQDGIKISDAASLNESKDSINFLSSSVEKKPKCSFVLMFYLYQIHKYFILVLLVFFIKFNLYYFKNSIAPITPLWEYLYQSAMKNKSSYEIFIDVILQLLCVNDFIFEDNPENNKEMREIFWIANNEIVFFMLSTMVIFIFYRIKKSINIFVISFGSLLLIARLAIAFTKEHYYSTIYFTSDHYGKFFHNPINNYPSYLIGIYFGLINYVLQKGMTIKNAKEESKLYLLNVIVNAKLMLKQSNKITFGTAVVILVLIVIFSMSQPLLLLAFRDYKDFITNTAVNAFYLVDVELVVFSLHYVFFSSFIKGENVLSNMISAGIWNIPHKMYYCIILVMTPVIYFFFYQSETRIMLRMSTITFFTLILWCLVFIAALILFLLFEVPYKRIIRFMTHLPKINRDSSQYVNEKENENEAHKEDTMLNVRYIE